MIQVPIVWYLVALLGGLRKVGSRLAIGARPADIARLFVRKHSVSFYETQIFSLLTMPPCRAMDGACVSIKPSTTPVVDHALEVTHWLADDRPPHGQEQSILHAEAAPSRRSDMFNRR
jgi:hypothetical protein